MKKVFITLLVLLITAITYAITPFPAIDSLSATDNPINFEVSVLNMHEDQPPGQCAGYSSAYILRHYGIDVLGKQVYEELSFKIPISGYVLPKGIIKYFAA